MIDHNGASGREFDLSFKRSFDLTFDLITGEQGQTVVVQLDLLFPLRHYLAHEVGRLLVGLGGVNRDLANVLTQVVPDRPDDEVAFLVDQKWRVSTLAGIGDCAPQVEQIVEVPLQLLGRTPDSGRADDHTHSIRDLQHAKCFAQFSALVALDATGYPSGPGVIGHEHQVSSGEADECGQRCALGAAFLLFDLNDQLLSFANHIADVDSARQF